MSSHFVNVSGQHFNPHSRAGSDVEPTPAICCPLYFNPHSRAGSDKVDETTDFTSDNFNPHSRAGSDNLDSKVKLIDAISIHTPVQGVTAR